MTSRDSHSENSPNDFSDLADLLEDFPDGTEPEEWAAWRDENILESSASREQAEKNLPGRSPLSSLPSEEEINQLFSESEGAAGQENSDWGDLLEFAAWEQEESLPPTGKLEDLLAAGGPEPESDLSALELDLLGELEPLSVPETLQPQFYEPESELELLLERPAAADRSGAGLFEDLEAAIEAPAPARMPPTAVESPPEKPKKPRSEIDFQDLEGLLEPTVSITAGPPSLTPSLVGGPRKSRKVGLESMRVAVKLLDSLSNLSGDLVVKSNKLEQDQERLRQFLDGLLAQVDNLSDVGRRMQDLYEQTLLEGVLLSNRQGRSPWAQSEETPAGEVAGLETLEIDRFTKFHDLFQETIEMIVRVRESASDIQFVIDETDQVTRGVRQVTNQLQGTISQARMVPFAQTADKLPRTVRELSLRLNKRVKLNVGEKDREVSIDKMIQDCLSDPMKHLIVNAITHGIEPPAVRQQRGKPPEGTITVRAFLEGNQTVITVADDGAGIDPEKVKAKALEKRVVSPEEARTLSESEIYNLLFRPGFTTLEQANNFAGRGVGLDVVKTQLKEIRGTATVDSIPGQGTTFTLRLPLTLTICKALRCLNDGEPTVFLADEVEKAVKLPPGELPINGEGKACIARDNGELLPIYPLKDLLAYNRRISRTYRPKPSDDEIAVVVLNSTRNFLAVQVDQFDEKVQEIVVQPIEGPVPKPAGIAGATILGDGSIVPVGDVLELMALARKPIQERQRPQLPEPVLTEKPTVLIVDDSILVREMLSLSFSKADYRVEQARHGLEAWEKLQAGLPCNLIICDIEMPQMTGFELLERLGQDERLSSIPFAFHTSRQADKFQREAAKLGASGYLCKPSNDKTLLDAAERMIRGEVLLAGSVRLGMTPATQSQPEGSEPPQAPPSPRELDHLETIADFS